MTQNDYELMLQELDEQGLLWKAAYHFTLHDNYEIDHALKEEMVQETFEALLKSKHKETIFNKFIDGSIMGYLIGIMNRMSNFTYNSFFRQHIRYYRMRKENVEVTQYEQDQSNG